MLQKQDYRQYCTLPQDDKAFDGTNDSANKDGWEEDDVADNDVPE
jgi:hypothetical protein